MVRGEKRLSSPCLHTLYARLWRGKAKINQIHVQTNLKGLANSFVGWWERETNLKFEIANN